MLNSILLNLLSHLVSSLIGSGVFAEIEALVLAEVSTTKTGAEKSAAVKAGLANVQGELGGVIKSTASFALNLGIETAVAVANTKLGVPAVVSTI